MTEFDRDGYARLVADHGSAVKLKSIFKAIARSDGFLHLPIPEATP